MDHREFYDAVKKIRELQKEYFKTRSQYTPEASKKQEKLIDAEIARVKSVLKQRIEAQQQKLFE